ncbi:response regulator [Xanthobacteraceae bacterium A53D]
MPVEQRPVCLVVEDEARNLMNAMTIAEESDFDVIQAVNAEDALKLLESRTDIRVVFTDVHLPGSIDGLSMARTVHERWPDIHILVASGKVDIDPALLPSKSVFLSKPYEPDMLEATLRTFMAKDVADMSAAQQ